MPVDNLYVCPLPAALGAMPNQECLVETGNPFAIAIQQFQAAPVFTGAGENAISALAPWTTQISSSTATGIRIIKLSELVITPGEDIRRGGNDGTTYRGMPVVLHGGFTEVAAIMKGVAPSVANAARNYTKFSRTADDRTKLRVFFFFDSGKIGHMADFNGAECYAFFVSDLLKGTEYRQEDRYNVKFALPYGWSKDLVYTDAAFDLASLINVV